MDPSGDLALGNLGPDGSDSSSVDLLVPVRVVNTDEKAVKSGLPTKSLESDKRFEELVVVSANELLATVDMAKEVKDLRRSIYHWIAESLSPSTITGIRHVYNQLVEEIINSRETYIEKVNSAEMVAVFLEFETEIRSRLDKEVRPLVTHLWEVLTAFRFSMETEFQGHSFFPSNKIDAAIQQNFENIKHSRPWPVIMNTLLDSGKLCLVACRVLGKYYKQHNRVLTKAHNAVVLECILIAGNRYKEELKLVKARGPWSPDILQVFHEHLLEKIDHALICALKGLDREYVQKWSRHLRTGLMKILKSSFKENLEAFEKIQSCTKSVLDKWQEEMENKLSCLTEKHLKTCFLDQGRLGTLEIEYLQESLTDTHLSLGDVWNVMDPESYFRKCLLNRATKVSEKFGSRLKDIVPLRSTPQLIIQLELNKICISLCSGNKTKAIFHPYGHPTIPDLIGRTKSGAWLIGKTLEEEIKSSSQLYGGVEKTWSIGNCLCCPEGSWSEEISVGKQETKKVTIEFLLGFFLALVKDKIEDNIKRKLSSVIITVPFWLASAQRQQILQSGKVAGFSSVELINDNTALACSQLSRRRKQNIRGIVIMFENSGWLDISFYSVNRERLELLHRIADYENCSSAIKPKKRYCDEISKVAAVEKMWTKILGNLKWHGIHWDDLRSDTLFVLSWKSDIYNDTMAAVADRFSESELERRPPYMTYKIVAFGSVASVSSKSHNTNPDGQRLEYNILGKCRANSFAPARQFTIFGKGFSVASPGRDEFKASIRHNNLVASNIEFYQESCYLPFCKIGNLSIRDMKDFEGNDIELLIQVSPCGVIDLTKVGYFTKTNVPSAYNNLVFESVYEPVNYYWIPCNVLTDEEAASLSTMIENFKQVAECLPKKQKLILFGELLKNHVLTCMLTTPDEQKNVLGQINRTLQVLKENACVQNEICEADRVFDSIRREYPFFHKFMI